MFWPQKDRRGDNFLLRSTEKSGGRGNPFSAIGVDAFRTSNFRSRFAMRGAEIHGNMRRDSTTRQQVYIYQVRYNKNIAENNSVAFIFQMYVQLGGIFLKCFDILKHLRASGKVDKIKKYRRDIPR